MTNRADEAGVVPGVTQSLDEFISSLHRKVAAMTLGAKQCNIIFLTVRFSVLHMEEAVSEGFTAGCTHEAGSVPCLPQGVHHFPHDLGVATSTGWSKEFLVAVLTIDVVLFLHEADVSQRHVAVVAVKLLGVPGPAKGHEEGAPDDAVAGSTQRCTAAGGKPLSPLSHAPRYRWEGGVAGGHGGGAWSWGPGR